MLKKCKLCTLQLKLEITDPDMVMLHMKEYIPDSDTPPVLMDAVLVSLKENFNFQVLFMQNFSANILDSQLLTLLKIPQSDSCNIWSINIGEISQVKRETWEAFAEGIKHTKIMHMYASENIIGAHLKKSM